MAIDSLDKQKLISFLVEGNSPEELAEQILELLPISQYNELVKAVDIAEEASSE